MSDNVPSLQRRVHPDTTALIVIDFQNDFCASGGWFDQIGHDLTANQAAARRVNAFLPTVRSVGMRTIFVRGIYDRHYLAPAQIERHDRMGYPIDHCHEGTWGADFYEVRPEAGDIIVSKHRYSAFVDTDLPAVLRSNGIESIVLAGTATNVCVESTARDGYMRDYHVFILSDCVATYSQELHLATLENVRRSFGVVLTSDELAELWAGDPLVERPAPAGMPSPGA
jgi:ureidoacrylate peracid hydrolase